MMGNDRYFAVDAAGHSMIHKPINLEQQPDDSFITKLSSMAKPSFIGQNNSLFQESKPNE